MTARVLWATVGQDTHGARLAERVNDLAHVLCGQRPALSDPDAAGAELGRLLDYRDGGGPVRAVGATLASRLDGIPDMEAVVASTGPGYPDPGWIPAGRCARSPGERERAGG